MSLKTPIAATLVSNTSLASGTSSRVAYDCRDIDVGLITARVRNAISAPATPIQFSVYVAHTAGATPAAAAEGIGDTDWKRVMTRAGDTVALSSFRFVYNFGPEVSHIMVEFTGHTTNPVNVEAHLSAASYD